MKGYVQRLLQPVAADTTMLSPAMPSRSPLAEQDQRLQLDGLADAIESGLEPSAPVADAPATASPRTAVRPMAAPSAPAAAPARAAAPAPVVQRRAAAPAAAALPAPVAPAMAPPMPSAASADLPAIAAGRAGGDSADLPGPEPRTLKSREAAPSRLIDHALPQPMLDASIPAPRDRTAEPPLDDPDRPIEPPQFRRPDTRTPVVTTEPLPRELPAVADSAELEPLPPARPLPAGESDDDLESSDAARRRGEPARAPGPARHTVTVREEIRIREVPVPEPPRPAAPRVPKSAADASIIGPLASPDRQRVPWDLWVR